MSDGVGRKARFPLGDGVWRFVGVLVVNESSDFRNGGPLSSSNPALAE
jgi:hypothetical protein